MCRAKVRTRGLVKPGERDPVAFTTEVLPHLPEVANMIVIFPGHVTKAVDKPGTIICTGGILRNVFFYRICFVFSIAWMLSLLA